MGDSRRIVLRAVDIVCLITLFCGANGRGKSFAGDSIR
jgi:hypothetical protein